MGEALADFRDDNDSWVLILTGAGIRAVDKGDSYLSSSAAAR